ncbi:KGG domain-containing protein [Levilactobacillus bambusae]|uniref:General stress protein B n=1 Tax=Levilactobacillus bambusae TaxID=2024736 RepID=A0A2V1N0N9_9LACO|nr:KGG domain-containing protein [Levilactobacillus bambusae]PWG00841.1 general stress protein B [Levilactobacillus bambusae]
MAENKKMSRQEAGHKGGEVTSQRHGKEFYQDIGHEGGETTAQTHGSEFYHEIGEKGGHESHKRS